MNLQARDDMNWIDTHCHLTERYRISGLDELLSAAAERGVSRMVNIGCGPTLADCREAVALAEAHDELYATVGMHPHEASGADDAFFDGIAELARNPRVVAIGETGLDYHYDNSPRDQQQASFRRHFELAREVGKPVVIHNRDSDEDCIRILNDVKPSDVGGVVHCFTASQELADCALEHGFYIGFTGIVSFGSAKSVRDVLRNVPRDRIVVETDSPFLAPKPHRGKKNQPAWVADVGAAVAEALELTVEETAELTTRNAMALYGWDNSDTA